MDYNLGEWTREARESIKMTQEEMAFALGFSTKASVSAIENGRQQPTFESMVNIAKLTGFPLPYQNEPVSIKVTDGYIKCIADNQCYFLPPEVQGGTPNYDRIIMDITAGDQHAYSIEEAEELGFTHSTLTYFVKLNH